MAFGDATECTGGENADANHADPCFSCVIEQPTVVLGWIIWWQSDTSGRPIPDAGRADAVGIVLSDGFGIRGRKRTLVPTVIPAGL
jgi:hypothetical protein